MRIKKAVVPENRVCYMSEVGHKNFYYPTDKKMILRQDCVYERLSWLGGTRGLKPIKVKISCILPTSFDKDPAYDILRNSDKETNIVVWIREK